MKFVPRGPISNTPPPIAQIMACRLVGAKPLSEPLMFFTDAYMRRSASMSEHLIPSSTYHA